MINRTKICALLFAPTLLLGIACSEPVPPPELSENVAVQYEHRDVKDTSSGSEVPIFAGGFDAQDSDPSESFGYSESVDSTSSAESEPVEKVAKATSSNSSNSVSTPSKRPSGERVVVERCVDGDTLIVRSSKGRERVRLVGANTPETVKPDSPVEPFGPEASAYTKQRVANANNVAYLVTDGPTHDKYGRRLAIVYLGNDTISLDEDLVRHGLARATLQYEFSSEMKDRLGAAQRAAKSENLGIHSLKK